jgi:mono/diheme cytochrome c family protein
MATGDKVDFAKQVWPIFIDKCIYCHGPKTKKGKLAMHTEALSLKGGSDDGPLYTPGRGAESPLIVRALTDDEDLIMPPPKEKKKLTEAEIKILTQWVDEGAVWAPVPPVPEE